MLFQHSRTEHYCSWWTGDDLLCVQLQHGAVQDSVKHERGLKPFKGLHHSANTSTYCTGVQSNHWRDYIEQVETLELAKFRSLPNPPLHLLTTTIAHTIKAQFIIFKKKIVPFLNLSQLIHLLFTTRAIKYIFITSVFLNYLFLQFKNHVLSFYQKSLLSK